MNDAARDEQTPHRGKGRDRIGEMLHAVVERYGVETGRRKIELFQTARGHAQANEAVFMRAVEGDLSTESFSSLSFHLDSALLADSGFTTGSSIMLDATFRSFQDRKEKVSFALPKPASSGTRTGPWKRHPQQNLSSG